MKKRLLVTVCASVILMANGAWAATAHDGVCGDGCTYTLEDGVLTITGTGDNAKIQDSAFSFSPSFQVNSVVFEGKITEIGSGAFYAQDMSSIAIPEGVTQIGDNAFDDCYYLSSITFPNTLTSVGERLIGFETQITSVILPENLTNIGKQAFQTDSYSNIDVYCPNESVCQAVNESFGSWEEVHHNDVWVSAQDNEDYSLNPAKIYTKQNGQYVLEDGTVIGTYTQSSISSKPMRRIYSVEEASAVAKPGATNTFRLRYR